MMNIQSRSEARLESIDIIHYVRALYKKKLLLFLTGLVAGGGALLAGAVQPTLYQATVSIKLNQNSAGVFAQNNVMTAVRSQDIRPELKGLGLVKMTFRNRPGRSAYMDLAGQSSSRRTAKRLTAAAALVFLERSRRLDAGSRPRGAGLTEILGQPKFAGVVDRELSKRTVLAAVIGVLAAATIVALLIYIEQDGKRSAPAKRAFQPVAK